MLVFLHKEREAKQSKKGKTLAIKKPPVLPSIASGQAVTHFLGVQKNQVQVIDLPKDFSLALSTPLIITLVSRLLILAIFSGVLDNLEYPAGGQPMWSQAHTVELGCGSSQSTSCA